jgi:putative membrane protein
MASTTSDVISFPRLSSPSNEVLLRFILLMEYLNFKALTASVVYSVLGIVILMVSFYVFNKLTPGTLRREILEEHNTALAIIAAAFMLAVALIISAAIHG